MAHSLFGTRFVAAREPGWHKIGTVVDEAAARTMTFTQALAVAGIDYTFTKVPMFYTDPDGVTVTSADRYAVLRSPTTDDPQWRDVGMVSEGFEVFQNNDLARGMDVIRKETGWTFETVGALDGGGRTFMLLRCGTRTVFGDQWKDHLLLTDGKAGGGALNFKNCKTRVVCANTVQAAEAENGITIRIPHEPGAMAEFDFWSGILSKLAAESEMTYRQMEAMGSVKIGDEQAMRIVERALPMPGPTDKMQALAAALANGQLSRTEVVDVKTRLEEASTRNHAARGEVAARRLATLELYKRFNAGQEQGIVSGGGAMPAAALAQLKETPYAALQAIVELVDHAGVANAKVAARSSLFGEGAKVKQRAWTAALELATRS
jgi:Domain of unknown function (DUF932)